MFELKHIKEDLKCILDEERYIHTIGVMYTAAALAMKYEYDINKAMLAGLLHDCAKCISSENTLKLCEQYNIKISDIEFRNSFLLHAKLGAYLAKSKYRVDNEEIISAILNHTTGKPDMTILEKIIFISDYIEPNRYKQKNLNEIRKWAFMDLDITVAIILKDTLDYLIQSKVEIDTQTEIAYNYYKKFLKI